MEILGIINDCGKLDWGGRMVQICPTLKAEAHGNLPKVVMKIKVKQATKQGYIECIEGGVLCTAYPDSKLRRGRVIDEGRTSPTLDTGCQVGVIQVGQIYGTEREPNPQAGRVYDANGISPTLDAMRGGNRMPKIIVKPCLTPDRAVKRQNGRRFKEDGEESFTLTGQDKHGVLLDDGHEVLIRRLTPKECFRLQGWTDDYFEKAQFVNSDSQLYKQAGNGVTVNVIEAIARRFEDGIDNEHEETMEKGDSDTD